MKDGKACMCGMAWLEVGDFFCSGRQLSKEIVVVKFARGRAVCARALGGGKPAKAGGGSRCPKLRCPSEGWEQRGSGRRRVSPPPP